MKASRLIFTLLLASSVAVVQLAAQQTKDDQKPIEEVKAKQKQATQSPRWNSVVATTRAQA
jgi:hypothetical protein